jgi:hypothetical protein
MWSIQGATVKIVNVSLEPLFSHGVSPTLKVRQWDRISSRCGFEQTLFFERNGAPVAHGEVQQPMWLLLTIGTTILALLRRIGLPCPCE